MTRSLLILLAAMTGAVPLAVDAYLPAMPQMAEFFRTDIHTIELSLSIFLGGFALGQLVGGPFSDHIGRRIATFSGLSLFCLGTLGIILSHSVQWLWLFRFIEALGGGIAVVNSAAVVRDLSVGKEMARHMANMMVIMLMAPLLAPVIGASLLYLGDWHFIFEFLLAYGLLLMIALFRNLPETRRPIKEKMPLYQRYWVVISHRHALGYIFSQCFAMAAMFASITASPSVFMEFFGVSPALFPLFFGANVLSLITLNRVNILLLRQLEPEQILKLGQKLQVLMGIILFCYVSFATLNIYVFTPLLMLFIGLNGLIVSNASSLTVHYFPNNAATATALSGAFGFLGGFLSGSLVSLLGDGTPWPMATIMLGCSITAITFRYLIQTRASNN